MTFCLLKKKKKKTFVYISAYFLSIDSKKWWVISSHQRAGMYLGVLISLVRWLSGESRWLVEAECHPGALSITSIEVEDLLNAPDFTCLSSIMSETETFYVYYLS